jgi:hypothetical protein
LSWSIRLSQSCNWFNSRKFWLTTFLYQFRIIAAVDIAHGRITLRLDCRWLRRVVVIEPTDGTAIRTRDQLAAGVDGDLDFSCPSCSLT